MPSFDLYPAGAVVQKAAPEEEYFPLVHPVQVSSFPSPCFPAGQYSQIVSEVVELATLILVPASHVFAVLHADSPLPFAYSPSLQGVLTPPTQECPSSHSTCAMREVVEPAFAGVV